MLKSKASRTFARYRNREDSQKNIEIVIRMYSVSGAIDVECIERERPIKDKKDIIILQSAKAVKTIWFNYNSMKVFSLNSDNPSE